MSDMPNAVEWRRAQDELKTWREVAIALVAEMADMGADPLCDAVLAYNHARNGRMAEALEVLA